MVCHVLSIDQLSTLRHKGCRTDNQAVREFAYDGNVDVTAWTENWLESRPVFDVFQFVYCDYRDEALRAFHS